MNLIIAISQNSFRQAIRSKIFVVLLFFSLGLILLSKLFEFLTFTAETKLIKDIGLTSIALVSALLAILLGSGAISGEIEKKTTYTLFSKPISRISFILGSFLGVTWSILLSLVVTGTTLFLLLFFKHYSVEKELLIAFFFIFLESNVIISLALMFSSFSSSTSTSTLFCFLAYLLGHFHPQLKYLGQKMEDIPLKWLFQFMSWILPNLEYFNVREQISRGLPIEIGYIGKATLYCLIYSWAAIFLGYLFLRKKEL